jgi:hypothetical protein
VYSRKKAANFFKTFLWAEETISTVNPDMYADRYTRYFAKVFPANDVLEGKPDAVSD